MQLLTSKAPLQEVVEPVVPPQFQQFKNVSGSTSGHSYSFSGLLTPVHLLTLLFIAPITAQDIIDNTPPEGITIKALLAKCKDKAVTDNATFINMVKAHLVYG